MKVKPLTAKEILELTKNPIIIESLEGQRYTVIEWEPCVKDSSLIEIRALIRKDNTLEKNKVKEIIKEMKEEFNDLSDFENETCWHGGVRQCLMYSIKKLENIYK